MFNFVENHSLWRNSHISQNFNNRFHYSVSSMRLYWSFSFDKFASDCWGFEEYKS